MLTGVGVASLVACIDLTIVNTAAPAIGRDLGATVLQTQLVVNVFFVAAAISVLPVGRLCDFFGRRHTLRFGIILFGLSSLGAGWAPDVHFLIACRFFQGVGCAVICIASSTIVFNAFPEHQRGKAMGTLFAINSASQAAGPLLGGLLVSVLDWRWVFLGSAPLAFIALGICSLSLGSSPDRHEQGAINWAGIGLFVPGLAGLVLGFSLGDSFGWTSWPILGALTAGVLSLAGFLVADRLSVRPLIPFRLFATPDFLMAVSAELASGIVITTTLFLLPLYLTVVHRLDDFTIGLLMLPLTATVALLSPVAGRLADRVGPQKVLMAGLVVFTLSASLQSLFVAGTGIGLVGLMAVLMGAGWACLLGPSAVTAVSAVPQHQSGTAIGTTWTFHTIGGSIGLKTSMLLFQASAGGHLDESLRARGVPLGSWTSHVVTRPQTGDDLLLRFGGVNRSDAADLMTSTFITGHRAVMLFLAGVSLAALLAIMVLSRTRSHGRAVRPQHPSRTPDAAG